jgi:hypothetical protein
MQMAEQRFDERGWTIIRERINNIVIDATTPILTSLLQLLLLECKIAFKVCVSRTKSTTYCGRCTFPGTAMRECMRGEGDDGCIRLTGMDRVLVIFGVNSSY